MTTRSAARSAARISSHYEDNVTNKAIDALFIVAQHDGCKWAHECRFVKDLCRATRVETGLWSAMTRVHYGRLKRTLLMYESQRGRLDRAQWLLARGAPIDASDHSGTTALTCATLNCHTDTVRALIAGGADVNIANNYGWTPLHRASLYDHIETVQVLIAGGAGVSIAGSGGMTPLHLASSFGRTDVVRALIAGGAGVNIANNSGETPLRLASTYGHTDIILSLREAGGV